MLPSDFPQEDSFETIRNQAVLSIAEYQTDWNNYNTSDTGIAILELLAWMQEIQQFFFNQSQMENIPLYLELLDLKPIKRHPATTIAGVLPDDTVCLHAHTGFFSDNLCFEPEKEYAIGCERICQCCVRTQSGELLWENKEEKNMTQNIWMFGKVPQEGNCLYLGFDREFRTNKRYAMYLEPLLPEGMQRNPVEPTKDILFCQYQLEYWNGSEWRCCRILQDETAGFIQSGFIEWMLDGKMKDAENLYWLRFHLLHCAFDVPPYLKVLDTHRLRLQQKQTIVCTERISIPFNAQGIYGIPLHDSLETVDEIQVYIKQEDAYCAVECRKPQEHLVEFQYVTEDHSALDVLEVLIRNQTGIAMEWKGNGLPNQVVDLEDTQLLGTCIQVLVETEKHSNQYRFWKQVPHLWNSGAKDECYRFVESEGKLVFGDGRHGAIPEGRIRLAACVRSKGLDGMIKADTRLSWTHGTAWTISSAEGGKNAESDAECLERCGREFRQGRQAVTDRDYEMLVKATPALIIHRVKVLEDDLDPTGLILIVEGGGEQRKQLHPVYQREIRKWMENKRLLGTHLKIESPVYIPVYIRLDIRIHTRFRQAEAWMKRDLEEYVNEYLNDFGAVLNYSHLYGMVDALPYVEEVVALTVSAKGRGVHEEQDGGFSLPDRGLAFLDELQIQVIRTTGG